MIQFSSAPSYPCYIVFISKNDSLHNVYADDSIKNTVQSIQKKEEFANIPPFPLWQENKIWIFFPIAEDIKIDEIKSIPEKIHQLLQSYKQSSASLYIDSFPQTLQSELLESLYCSQYRFDNFFGSVTKAEHEQKKYITNFTLEIIAPENNEYKALYDGINLTKDLVNLPPSLVHPEYFVQEAEKKLANIKNITMRVLLEHELTSLGMNGIVSVGKCAKSSPRMLVVEYFPTPAKNPLVVVGKGVTYDTGGLSLKTGGSMRHMKRDMAGAATALGSIFAAAQLKLQNNIVAIMPLAENAIGPNAYKPDDIITMANGVTVEVTNTDAEGRLLLGDALWYAQKNYTPSAIIDFATLTGACQYAVGDEISAVFCNNDTLMNRLQEVAKKTHEPIWQLPLYAPYKKKIRSKVADIVNAASDFPAGTMQAALFLEHFIENSTVWAHFDIAFTAFDKKSELATARHVKTIIELLKTS